MDLPEAAQGLSVAPILLLNVQTHMQQTCYQSPHTQSKAWGALDTSLSTSITTTPSTAVSGLPSTSTASPNSITSSEINVRFAASAKLGHNTTKAVPSSTIPIVTRRGMPALNERQLDTPTSTIATAPPAPGDEKQDTHVSRKWKMVALALAAILGAILVVGLVVFLGCGWLVLDLLDRSDKS
jgi:hypothetical protein